jgi:hypothetical protein
VEQVPDEPKRRNTVVGLLLVAAVVMPHSKNILDNSANEETDDSIEQVVPTEGTITIERNPEPFSIEISDTTLPQTTESTISYFDVNVIPATTTTSIVAPVVSVTSTTTTLPLETTTIPSTLAPETLVTQPPSVYEQNIDCGLLTTTIQDGMTLFGLAEYCSPFFEIAPNELVNAIKKFNPQINDFDNIPTGTVINLTELQVADPQYTPPVVNETLPSPAKIDIQDLCDSLSGTIVTIEDPGHIKRHLLGLGLTSAQAENIMFRENDSSYLRKYQLTNPISGQKACMAGSLEALKAQYPNTLGG